MWPSVFLLPDPGQAVGVVDIFRPPKVQSLPDVLTIEETWRLINSVRKLRYRVFFLTLYSMGLRLGEGLQLEVGDIDAAHRRVHVQLGKSKKDCYAPLPRVTLDALRMCCPRASGIRVTMATCMATARS